MSRRSFLAWSGLLAGSIALSGCSPEEAGETSDSTESEEPTEKSTLNPIEFEYDTVVWNGCHVNCGSRCPLKVYVKDGAAIRITGDEEGSDDFGPNSIYQMRTCVRGRTNRQRIYNTSRIQAPLKRTEGTKRGEGKYERITWDEAIETIAQTMEQIKEEYGNDAFYIQYGTGQLGGTVSKSWSPDDTMLARLMNLWGGYLHHYSDYSTGQITWELPLLNGDAWSNNEVTDLQNSKHIIMFGNNPANTRMNGSSSQYLFTQVRQQNPDANIIVIDPLLTDTVIGIADEWVPLRPGTDAALVAGMVHHLLNEGKLDEAHIKEKCIGFYSEGFIEEVKLGEPASSSFMGFDVSGSLAIAEDMSYEAYLKGTGAYSGSDEKTPEWAAKITGVPADTIRRIAECYTDGPTATIQGWGPQRHANGGNSSRAIALLPILTKNVGIAGGGTGAREAVGGVSSHVASKVPTFQELNTVDTAVSFFGWFRAIEDYASMNDATWGIRRLTVDESGKVGYAYVTTPGELALKAPIKFIWNYASNIMLGQHADINECLRLYNLPDEAASGVRMIVTVDCYMTPTAQISDIVLPGTTSFEEDDLIFGGSGWTGFVCCESAAVAPLFESKPIYEICTLLAARFGIEEEFTEGRTQLDWVRWCYEQGVAAGDAFLPDTFEEFKAQGLWKFTDAHEPVIAAPTAINTPSGKYEVFSKQAYNLSKQWDLTSGGYVSADGKDKITGLPEYYAAPEGYGDEEQREEYPFQLIGHHGKTRTHSSYGNVEWMEQAAPHQVWINAQDAEGLGISNDNEVELYNERGRTLASAKVTSRIMPGVISLPQGAWYNPENRDPDRLHDPSVVDRGGCISMLTSMRPTPLSKGNGAHTALCNAKKAQGRQ